MHTQNNFINLVKSVALSASSKVNNGKSVEIFILTNEVCLDAYAEVLNSVKDTVGVNFVVGGSDGHCTVKFKHTLSAKLTKDHWFILADNCVDSEMSDLLDHLSHDDINVYYPDMSREVDGENITSWLPGGWMI